MATQIKTMNIKSDVAMARTTTELTDVQTFDISKLPNGITYVGSRYVPLFADPLEWNNQTNYEPLTIVLHEGNSYTSRQYVPVGVDILNEDYWALTGNYNAQVEQYRQETLRYFQRTEEVEDLANEIGNRVTVVELDYIKNFDTVNDMVVDTTLEIGMVVSTTGFYAQGDGGSARYIITNSATPNTMDVIALDNGYKAVLIIEDELNLASLGYKNGNGNADSTIMARGAELSPVSYNPPKFEYARPMINTKLYGNTFNACGTSIKANCDTNTPEVMNATTSYLAKTYRNRDNVGAYIENTQIPYTKHYNANECSYTLSNVTVPNTTDVKVGMYAQVGDSRENFTYLGKIINVSDNLITVDGWFNPAGNTGEIPTGELFINPVTKIWGANINVHVPEDGRCAGVEIGVISNNSRVEPDVTGLAVENLGTKPITNGIRVRGNKSTLVRGMTIDGARAGYVNYGAEDNLAFVAGSAGNNSFTVNNKGVVEARVIKSRVALSTLFSMQSASSVVELPTTHSEGEIVLIYHTIFSGATIKTTDGCTLSYGTSTGTTSRTFSPTKCGVLLCVFKNNTWFMSE